MQLPNSVSVAIWNSREAQSTVEVHSAAHASRLVVTSPMLVLLMYDWSKRTPVMPQEELWGGDAAGEQVGGAVWDGDVDVGVGEGASERLGELNSVVGIEED